jgi:hypothetical protein
LRALQLNCTRDNFTQLGEWEKSPDEHREFYLLRSYCQQFQQDIYGEGKTFQPQRRSYFDCKQDVDCKNITYNQGTVKPNCCSNQSGGGGGESQLEKYLQVTLISVSY